jgi:hypothetical protein
VITKANAHHTDVNLLIIPTRPNAANPRNIVSWVPPLVDSAGCEDKLLALVDSRSVGVAVGETVTEAVMEGAIEIELLDSIGRIETLGE